MSCSPIADLHGMAAASVDLWLASLDGPASPEVQHWLSAQELAHAANLKIPIVAQRYKSGRGTLRAILGSYLGCSPSQVNIEQARGGKPFLCGESSGNLYFNVSHSGGYALYGVCQSAEVGVDLQFADVLSADSGVVPSELAATICSPEELRYFREASPAEQRRLFYRIWTRKEAYVKCLGTGLADDPTLVPVPASDAEEVLAGSDELQCSLRTFELGESFIASVAVLGCRGVVRKFAWWPGQESVKDLIPHNSA